MKLAFPIVVDAGLESEVCSGLEEAVLALAVAPDGSSAERIRLPDPAPGVDRGFRVADALLGARVDAVVVDAIGEDLRRVLAASDVAVYRSPFPTVADALDALASGALRVEPPPGGCGCHDPFRRGCGGCGG